MKIGNSVQKLRKKKGYSQAQLCHLAKIDQSWLSQLENNLIVPTFATLDRLSRALDTTSIRLIIEGLENEDFDVPKRKAFEALGKKLRITARKLDL